MRLAQNYADVKVSTKTVVVSSKPIIYGIQTKRKNELFTNGHVDTGREFLLTKYCHDKKVRRHHKVFSSSARLRRCSSSVS
jgi:hypothetical protein